ncbi:unnamed protein product [Rhizopus stolonifer]
MEAESSQPVKRRARMALSCQRSKPECEQCKAVGSTCNYLNSPGDLESTALRNRFAGLEDQIHSVVSQFDQLEDLFHVVHEPESIKTRSLQDWKISRSGSGLSIDTHLSVSENYSKLLEFAQDNNRVYPHPDDTKNSAIWLTRNQSIYNDVQLSHFTSLKPNESIPDEPTLEPEMTIPNALPTRLIKQLLTLYQTCLLYGAIGCFDSLFSRLLSETALTELSPALQLLYASIVCHMLPHAFYWHPEIFEGKMDQLTCTDLSLAYYRWAKQLLSSMYFDSPSLMTCHAICNLVLYHIENGHTSVVYLYSGMAVRMALSLQLYREDALDGIAQASQFSKNNGPMMKEYARSLVWFMYFLDTASSHYHNKPYEVHLDHHLSTTTYFQRDLQDNQALFQWIEFHTCQITRDIRRTIFTESAQTSYEAIERIERRLLDFQKQLPLLTMTGDVWQRRCVYIQWIRHHGQWILIHQNYLPTPMSVQRCTVAAFALVDLFDGWEIDCYFRPCVHELKQACEILLYHVDQETEIKPRALEGLARLIEVLLKTPVGEIAKTRPFVQRVLKAIQDNSN